MMLTPPTLTWSSAVPPQLPVYRTDRFGEPAQPISPTPMAISSRSIVSLVDPTHPQPEHTNYQPVLWSTKPVAPLKPGIAASLLGGSTRGTLKSFLQLSWLLLNS